MDHMFRFAAPDDPECPPGHLKYEMLIRTGIDAYVMVFFQRIADLSWIGTLQTSNIASEMVRGLWYSKRVVVKCFDFHLDFTTKPNLALNKWLSHLQDGIARMFAEIGEHISKHANRPPGWENDDVQSWRPGNDTDRDLVDFLGWMHFLDKSDPGLKWKDCDNTNPGCNTEDPFLVADESMDEGSSSCLEEGMCDPWSSYYTPPGVSEGIDKVYDEWYKSIGGQGKFSEQNLTAMGNSEGSLSLNAGPSSTTAVPTGPVSMPYDPNIPDAFQDHLFSNLPTTLLAMATPTSTSRVECEGNYWEQLEDVRPLDGE